MKLKQLDKKAQTGIGQLPGFFQIMMLVVIFAGLTFIVLDKFLDTSYDSTTLSISNETLSLATSYDNVSISGLRDVTCFSVFITNQSGAVTVDASNYTIDNCQVYNKTSTEAGKWVGVTWNASYSYTYEDDTSASTAINDSTSDLYDYGIGFLGILILVVMVYLIISIVSGRKSGAR